MPQNMPSSEANTQAICKQIQDNHSSCDASDTRSSKKKKFASGHKENKILDALLVLEKVPYAVHLSDISESSGLEISRSISLTDIGSPNNRTQTVHPGES